MNIDGRSYRVETRRLAYQGPHAPRLLVVAHQSNALAADLLRVCVRTIRRFTPEDHELWVIDNNSPEEYASWLLNEPDVNLVLNRTEPLPPEARSNPESEPGSSIQGMWGSYANAVGLELGVRHVDAASQLVMTLHMDTMPCVTGWLSYLMSRITGSTVAAGVRMDHSRVPEGVLHILGCLFDFPVFQRLGPSFFPCLPELDVGDRLSVEFRAAGYNLFACPNSLWEPALIKQLPMDSPFRRLPVDRSFDDRGNPIFLHLGRGLRLATGQYEGRVPVGTWIAFAEQELL